MTVKIPSVPHYAVIVQSTSQVWHEGDERSRTHPGHGYPAGYETIHKIEYEAFENIEDVARWVANPRNAAKNYTIINATPMRAETKIVVNVK